MVSNSYVKGTCISDHFHHYYALQGGREPKGRILINSCNFGILSVIWTLCQILRSYTSYLISLTFANLNVTTERQQKPELNLDLFPERLHSTYLSNNAVSFVHSLFTHISSLLLVLPCLVLSRTKIHFRKIYWL